MYIALAYDISSNCADRVRKLCEQYLVRAQKSVFEGEISERNYNRLKAILEAEIDAELDSVIIYRLDSFGAVKKESIGKTMLVSLDYL